MFSIHSSDSNRELVFSNRLGEYFQVELEGEISASTTIYLYTDAENLCRFFEDLGNYEKPWEGERNWESIEDDFFISATCSSLGVVLFNIRLTGNQGTSEEWQIKIGINSELGQLNCIAHKAIEFFRD